MSANTSIQWTDLTWNPVRGCSVVSPGCHSCYAMKMAHRFSGPGKAYEGLTKQTKAGPQWTGKIRLVPEALDEPASWRKPARVFVNSMSDLFHDGVPWSFIEHVFDAMQESRRHTFQILTKRPQNMRLFMENWVFHRGAPLPNVWLGVSAEDQQRADERIPLLLQTPAAVRFISAEPLLGPIDLERGGFALHRPVTSPTGQRWPGLDWVIVGGESGPRARVFDVTWARTIIAQCKAAGVACFMKQLGTNPLDMEHSELIDTEDRKGGDINEWPESLRVREFPTQVPA